jgi:hypothetical protein
MVGPSVQIEKASVFLCCWDGELVLWIEHATSRYSSLFLSLIHGLAGCL